MRLTKPQQATRERLLAQGWSDYEYRTGWLVMVLGDHYGTIHRTGSFVIR